jgi:uncharacterized membrane protein YczE
MRRRIFMTIAGTVLTAFCIALFRKISWGVDPFSCLIEGFESSFGISYGLLMTIILGILLTFTFIMDRHYIGLATFITLFLQGAMVDFLENQVLNRYLPAPDTAQKMIMMLLALFSLCFGASLYITSDLGVSAYDAVSLIMTEKTGWKYRVCRLLTDAFCTAVGVILHGNVGVITVVTASCMGSVVSWMNVHWAEQIRYGKLCRKDGNKIRKGADART